jgi:hypothetical protein
VRGPLLGPVLLALALRLTAVLAFDDVAADVERYQRVARHLLDVSWNPYGTNGLYPYPPPWAGVEAGAEWLARHGVGSFPVNVKLPVVASDLLLTVLLGAAARAGRASPLAPWLYAVHPVSLLVGGVHGQFDSIPLLFLLAAVEAQARQRRDLSAVALAAAIATKSFPVLALPFLALGGRRPSWPSAARYAVLAVAPGAALLLPFAVADAGALRRELVAYGGIADFGWTGVLRGAAWLVEGVLARSEARFWPAASILSRGLFLGAWTALVLAVRARRLRLDPPGGVLAALLAFASVYGLQSAQYLLWVVPLGLLRPGRRVALHAAAATAGLVGFYLFLAPGVLAGPLAGEAAFLAGCLWLGGALATLAASFSWLVAVLRGGWDGGLRAATEAMERPSKSPSR